MSVLVNSLMSVLFFYFQLTLFIPEDFCLDSKNKISTNKPNQHLQDLFLIKPCFGSRLSRLSVESEGQRLDWEDLLKLRYVLLWADTVSRPAVT